MIYLRNRLPEWSTWLGLIVAVAALALFWLYRQEIYSALVAIAGSAIAASPERSMAKPIRALLALIRPATPQVAPPRSIPMSSNFVASLEAAALEAVKVTAAALPAPTGPAVSAVLAAFEDRSTANVLAAVIAVVSAVEAALAVVPPAPVAETNVAAEPVPEPVPAV